MIIAISCIIIWAAGVGIGWSFIPKGMYELEPIIITWPLFFILGIIFGPLYLIALLFYKIIMKLRNKK